MEKLKKKSSARLSAYILMILCAVVMVFSSMIICVNIAGEWYSVGPKAVKNDIYNRTANEAEEQIFESLYDSFYYESDELYSSEVIEEGTGSEDDADTETENQKKEDTKYAIWLRQYSGEILVGESSADGFGYSIYQYDYSEDGEKSVNIDTEPVRQINAGLAEREDVFVSGTDYDYFHIDIYLGDLSSQQLPDHVVPVYKYLSFAYSCRYVAILTAVMSLIAGLFFMLFLMKSVGENYRGNDDRRTFALKAVPLDLAAVVLAAACIGIICEGIYGISDLISNNMDLMIAAVIALAIAATVIVTGFVLLMTARVKLGKWWHSTVIYQCIRLLKWLYGKIEEMFVMIPIVWRTSLILAGCLILNILLTIVISESMWFGNSAFGILLWIASAAVVSYATIRFAVGLKKLKEGGRHLADGDLEYNIDPRGLWFDLKEHAENLNSIGKGMENAVAVKMQSERFKNELITNVSHDLKTPLTSIINYVDLLKKEEPENEKISEYIDVLDRQSQRLKRLTEDVVEASKVATGNVKMDMVPCQVGTLMAQLMGEYSEKAEENDLIFVMDIPKDDVSIMADRRSMWRVLNNLLSNICKYSLPGTRVYQTIDRRDGNVIITYKNISKYELNISGKELTERFMRGDKSRHTEGSGLGLSIAQNLVELQEGSFDIIIDGDLFKVKMEFKELK